MIEESTFFILLASVFLFEIIVCLFVCWNEIFAFLFPNDYGYAVIKNLDRSIFSKIVKKDGNKQFTYNKVKYNLFYPALSNAPTFLKGRLNYYEFLENDPIPRNLDLNQSINDGTLDDKVTKQEFNSLWKEEFSIGSWIADNLLMLLVVIGFIVIVVVLILNKGNA